MADLTCGGKGPAGNVPAGFPVAPGVQTFPAGQWVTVIDWSGMTTQILGFRAKVISPLAAGGGPPDVLVRWRRYGLSLLPYAEGSFQGQADLNIYPVDAVVKIELRVDTPDTTISVDFFEGP
jgi:hypothetical protein